MLTVAVQQNITHTLEPALSEAFIRSALSSLPEEDLRRFETQLINTSDSLYFLILLNLKGKWVARLFFFSLLNSIYFNKEVNKNNRLRLNRTSESKSNPRLCEIKRSSKKKKETAQWRSNMPLQDIFAFVRLVFILNLNAMFYICRALKESLVEAEER